MRQGEADTATLAEARHDAAGTPEIAQALHGAHQRIAIGRESEGAVDDALDAGFLQHREVLVAERQIGLDAVKVGLQQFAAEFPRCLARLPRHACLFIGAEDEAAALLAHVDLCLEVDDVRNLAAAFLVVGDDFGDFLGHQIHVLHGEHRQFDAGHAADLSGPQAAAVHHMLGVDRALVGNDIP